ncbi:MAG: hypothetical protein IPL40_12545 [Proteobacteria bacterium]|nr:hypothetical protein [Pseudomonadota bacterium]
MPVMLWLALGLSLLAAAGRAGAEAASSAAEHRARQEFARAQQAYDLGAYDEAITRYEAAYRAWPAPAFLFNIAQAYRLQYRIDHQLEHLRRALALYDSYLRQHTLPPNGELVQRLQGELRATLAAEERRSATAAAAGRSAAPGPAAAALQRDARATAPVAIGAHAAPTGRARRSSTGQPFYRRGWFWALTAAVVGAGAGVGTYVALRDPGTALPQIDLRR